MIRGWPPQPYRGLNYFRPQDRPLLGGRDDDVVACSVLLAHPQTRVLLLHGSTGCGKSSFLRAGLIPTMEEEGAGYLFLKIADADDEALFIRCTEAPIDQIARQVFLFSSEPFRLRTPVGWRELDLTPALLGLREWEAYLKYIRDRDCLVDSVRKISEIIPQKLVLIVDQAEEVLTLNPSEANFENRSHFFSFLRAFQKLEFDARIIVTLRTEYFGRFIDAIQISSRAAGEFQQFFLSELSRPALVEAILRPTRKDKVEPFGVPHATYGFEFDDGLAQIIVDDILGARYSGPALPVLQLVCLGLYEECKRRGSEWVKKIEYTSTGRVDGLMIRHIAGAIRTLYSTDVDYKMDIEGLRAFLGLFYSMQDDGSVVARTLDQLFVMAELAKRGLRVASDQLIISLSSPQTMILRMLRNVKADGRMVDELTLGHDSVALALERWKALDTEERIQQIKVQQQIELKQIHEIQRVELHALSVKAEESRANI